MKTIEELNKELKRVASIKCRLKKAVGKVGNREKLIEVERYENELKEMRMTMIDRKKYVTEYTWEDIMELNYIEVCKAISSIKSKKSLSRWLTDVEGDNDEFRNAVVIEEMLYKRKEMVEGEKKTWRSEISRIIEESGGMTKEEIIDALKEIG